MKKYLIASLITSAFVMQAAQAADYVMTPTKEDKVWLLPPPPHVEGNAPNPARIDLGKKLFFDTRLSSDGNMSCATCHNPAFGWSDGLSTAKGFKSKVLGRASPTVINTVYNPIQMWDGRKKDLMDQATGPLESPNEMATDIPKVLAFLNSSEGYKVAFAKAYPGEGINLKTLAKAIAAYEATIISNNSPFDRWVKGDKKAMTQQQVKGFRLFTDPNKGNCVVCHSAPNFTDSSFNNVGLASFGQENADMGRYEQRKVAAIKGAFKTPTIRDITLTAPYFHDGSVATLKEVVAHYNVGGVVKTNLSPNIKVLNLSEQEQADIVAFMEALTSTHVPVTLPELPLTH